MNPHNVTADRKKWCPRYRWKNWSSEFFSNWPTVGQLIRGRSGNWIKFRSLTLSKTQTASSSQAKWWSLPSDTFFWSHSSSVSNSQQLLKKRFHNYSPKIPPGLSIYAKIRPPFQTSNWKMSIKKKKWKMSRCSCFAIQHFFKKSQSFLPFIKKKKKPLSILTTGLV